MPIMAVYHDPQSLYRPVPIVMSSTESPANEISGVHRLRSVLSSGGLVAVTVAIFLFSQWRVLAHFWRIWNMPDYYYSHGILVPFLAGVMIWMNKQRVAAAPMRSSWYGVLLVCFAAALTLTGTASGFEEVSSAGFMLGIYAVIIAVVGLRVAGILFLPVLFLVMMIPVPEIILESATGRYQIVSTALAAKLLGFADHSVARYGNVITANGLPEALVIGAPCSGLKMLITLLMCASFLAYVLEGPRLKKSALLLIAFPLSILVNSIRIVLIGLVGLRSYSAEAMHTWHDSSGYISLAICAALLLGFARLIGMRYFRTFPAVPDEGRSPLKLSAPWMVALVVLLLAALGSARLADLYDLPKGRLARERIPGSFGKWIAYELPIGPTTGATLTKADVLYRAYVRSHEDERPIYVFISGAYELSMMHDPNLCLPGSGLRVTDERVITIRPAAPGIAPINASLMRIEGGDGVGLMIHWYSLQGDTLPGKNDVNKSAYLSRLNDILKLAANPFSVEQVKRDILSRQIVWHRFSTDADDEKKVLRELKRFVEEFTAHSAD